MKPLVNDWVGVKFCALSNGITRLDVACKLKKWCGLQFWFKISNAKNIKILCRNYKKIQMCCPWRVSDTELRALSNGIPSYGVGCKLTVQNFIKDKIVLREVLHFPKIYVFSREMTFFDFKSVAGLLVRRKHRLSVDLWYF